MGKYDKPQNIILSPEQKEEFRKNYFDNRQNECQSVEQLFARSLIYILCKRNNLKVTTLAKHLKMGDVRLYGFIADPFKFNIYHLTTMAGLFGVTPEFLVYSFNRNSLQVRSPQVREFVERDGKDAVEWINNHLDTAGAKK